MTIELLSIGDELLAGRIVNTNAAFISHQLAQEGWRISRETTLPDEFSTLVAGFKEACERSTIVIATGGLGPTCDDHTRAAAAAFFQCAQVFDEIVAADIALRFGKDLASLQDQATRPARAQPLLNAVGTAPGLIFSEEGCTLILLPGVPQEMRPMLTNGVIPYLKRHFQPEEKRFVETLHLCAITESEIDTFLKGKDAVVQVGLYPDYGIVHLVLSSTNQAALKKIKEEVESAFATHLFSAATGKIEEALLHFFVKHQKKLALAESCTGGSLAAAITRIPGASEYFLGSFVVYSNELKTAQLHVPALLLKEKGAVSAETAKEMLRALFELTTADVGVAVTGIAGPSGGSAEKPVGTVWVAIGERGLPSHVVRYQISGNREKIIGASCTRILSQLWRKLVYKVDPA
jgi:nicotinamide-nucleotide amidase